MTSHVRGGALLAPSQLIGRDPRSFELALLRQRAVSGVTVVMERADGAPLYESDRRHALLAVAALPPPRPHLALAAGAAGLTVVPSSDVDEVATMLADLREAQAVLLEWMRAGAACWSR